MYKNIYHMIDRFQFSRRQTYYSHIDFLLNNFKGRERYTKVIEFGGGNDITRAIFNDFKYEEAPNYPDVNIESLDRALYPDNTYDIVILDEVLEHVEDPVSAISECYRILKNDAYLMMSTPFLIAVHNCPSDYWRFTPKALELMLKNFTSVHISSWGNKQAVNLILDDMMISSVKIKSTYGFIPNHNEPKYPISIWAYAKK